MSSMPPEKRLGWGGGGRGGTSKLQPQGGVDASAIPVVPRLSSFGACRDLGPGCTCRACARIFCQRDPGRTDRTSSCFSLTQPAACEACSPRLWQIDQSSPPVTSSRAR